METAAGPIKLAGGESPASMKPTLYLINAISRSGGTYINALLDGLHGVGAFPIEVPFNKALTAGFLSQDEFAALGGVEDWLRAIQLDIHLDLFAGDPHGRTFAAKDGNRSALAFDVPGFRARLGEAFRSIGTVGEAYRITWRTFFDFCLVRGQSFGQTAGPFSIYANHFATNAIGLYEALEKDAAPVCDLHLIHVVRDPLENINSLYYHWRFSSVDPHFVRLAFARWEVYLYTALRNRLLYPERCDTVLYTADTDRLRARFAVSPLPLLKMAGTAAALRPTVLGLDMANQSYKERQGISAVDKVYDHESLIGPEGVGYIKENLQRVLTFLGVDALEELMALDAPKGEFSKLMAVDGTVMSLFLNSFGEALYFPQSYSLNFVGNMKRILRNKGALGLGRAAYNTVKRTFLG